MKRFCQFFYILIFLSSIGILNAQEEENKESKSLVKGLNGFTFYLNGGYTTLTGKGKYEVNIPSVIRSSKDIDNVQYSGFKVGLGSSWTFLPLNKLITLGALIEARGFLGKLAWSTTTAKSEDLIFNIGIGGAVGPYLKLSFLGHDRPNGLGLSPYFTLNFLRKESSSDYRYGNTVFTETQSTMLGLGAGLLVNVQLGLIGFHAGAEFLLGVMDITSDPKITSAALETSGALFYAGINLAF